MLENVEPVLDGYAAIVKCRLGAQPQRQCSSLPQAGPLRSRLNKKKYNCTRTESSAWRRANANMSRSRQQPCRVLPSTPKCDARSKTAYRSAKTSQLVRAPQKLDRRAVCRGDSVVRIWGWTCQPTSLTGGLVERALYARQLPAHSTALEGVMASAQCIIALTRWCHRGEPGSNGLRPTHSEM